MVVMLNDCLFFTQHVIGDLAESFYPVHCTSIEQVWIGMKCVWAVKLISSCVLYAIIQDEVP